MIAAADVIVTCTGSDSQVLSVDLVERAMGVRLDRPLFILDVAVPRDVDTRVGELAGVVLFDIDALAPLVNNAAAADDVLEARRIVDAELGAYVSARRASGVAPTVVALRDKAAQMVSAELHRLERRLPDLDDVARAEIAATMQRVVDKVLHAPTVRVQELADTAGPTSYPEALRRLFDLDPSGPAALVVPDLDRRRCWDGRAAVSPISAPAARPTTVLRLGTRRSVLAMAQATLVAEALRAGGSTVELVGVTTEGDRTTGPLTESGGTGVFVTQLRARLLDGSVDIVVHSLKDLPTQAAPDLVVAAVPPRADARDALVARDALTLANLPVGASVGTGSPRRAAQLLAVRPDLKIRALARQRRYTGQPGRPSWPGRA